jgi:hypothetical protein
MAPLVSRAQARLTPSPATSDTVHSVTGRPVSGIQVFEAQRTNGCYLGDVLAGFCPVEMRRIAGQNDDGARRIRLHLVTLELIAEADVENAGDDRVDPVLRMSVRHQPHARGHFDPDHVGAGL